MGKISAETIAQYEKALAKDPSSKLFAALADAYRDMGRMADAESLARDGIERHPEYVGGYLVFARILLATRRADQAEEPLKKAVELSPENLLAYQLLGQVFVEMKRPAEALKAHKMVLFLNPLSDKSRQAVEKLETLTAVDYEDEVFEMRPLANNQTNNQTSSQTTAASKNAFSTSSSSKAPALKQGDLERSLSFIDALIVRNDLSQAKEKLQILSEDYPDSAEVQKRWHYFEEDDGPQEIESLRPVLSRERDMLERKKRKLQQVLKRIEHYRMNS